MQINSESSLELSQQNTDSLKMVTKMDGSSQKFDRVKIMNRLTNFG